MLVKMECIEYDENSVETVPLELRGVYVGDFSFGLYSRWYNQYKNSHNTVISNISYFVCKLIKDRFNAILYNSEDVKNYIPIFYQQNRKNIAEWFEEYMREDIQKTD